MQSQEVSSGVMYKLAQFRLYESFDKNIVQWSLQYKKIRCCQVSLHRYNDMHRSHTDLRSFQLLYSCYFKNDHPFHVPKTT